MNKVRATVAARWVPWLALAVMGCGSSRSAGEADAGAGGATAAAGGGGSAGGQGGGRSTGAGQTSGASGGGGLTADGGDGGGIAMGNIYVAPSGDDANPGTLAQPVRTLTRAQAIVRAQNSTMTSDITVYLRGGTYPLTSTQTFTNADSGNNGFYVKYLAYQSERPLITGGQPITGWKVFDAARNIYSASGVTSRFRQLYVDGVKAIRARSPNLGPNGAASFDRIVGFDKTARNVQIPSSDVANWNNLTKVELHYMINWTDDVLRLASFTTSGNTAFLKFQSPEADILFVREYPTMGLTTTGKPQCFYLENALEFLDQPGEWYLDETADVLYYMPRVGEDLTTATVVAPMVETLLSVQGTSTSDPAEYLWFQGLTFAHSTYLVPSQQGFLDLQAGQYSLVPTMANVQYVGRPSGGVTVTNASHIQFEGNMFTQMAATGLDFISGTHDDMILGNVFTDIGGSGISIGKFAESNATEIHLPYNPGDVNEICTNDTIKDNYIYNVTTEIQGACGIAAGYPRDIDIEHNEVAQVNYSGISVGYGWTTATNAMSNNILNYNNVHGVAQILADGAAIYVLSNQAPASQMEFNYLHDFSQSQWADYQIGGLYLDQGTTGYTVANNVFVNAPSSIFQNQTGANTLTNNNGSSPTTVSGAGLEPAYLGIKSMTIPVPAF